MAYNKAKEERKWRLWKEEEEREMRRLGVSEDIIQRLHAYDWEVFNADRRFYQWEQDSITYLEEIAEQAKEPEINSVDELLDELDDQRLYQILIKADKRTLRAILMKMQGYSTSEIAERLEISEFAVYFRIRRIKEKIKKISTCTVGFSL